MICLPHGGLLAEQVPSPVNTDDSDCHQSGCPSQDDGIANGEGRAPRVSMNRHVTSVWSQRSEVGPCIDLPALSAHRLTDCLPRLDIERGKVLVARFAGEYAEHVAGSNDVLRRRGRSVCS